MNDINFTEYDRISDTVMYLSDIMSLVFTVSFSRKNKSGDRVFYQYETMYGSDKYGIPLRSIKRVMSYSFIIDCKGDFLAGMMLRPQDVELIVRLIDMKVLPWFLGGPKEAYKVIDDKLYVTEYEPATYVQNSKYLCFEPDIATDKYGLQSRGIKLSLSSDYYAILSTDSFMGFYNILKNTDMYGVACSLCNYAKMEPHGTNVYSAQGLGASPNNNNIDETWNKSFGRNSFLDSTSSKKEK